MSDKSSSDECLDLYSDSMATPLGEMVVIVDEQERLRILYWEDSDERKHKMLNRFYGEKGRGYKLHQRRMPKALRHSFSDYFAGELNAIDHVVVEARGTEFQREVWHALRDIPVGGTVSYGTLAKRIGRPKAVRAVGLANGANPVSLVVPCHRVIGSDGSLTGYGGGLHRKQWLLAHEGDAFTLT